MKNIDIVNNKGDSKKIIYFRKKKLERLEKKLFDEILSESDFNFDGESEGKILEEMIELDNSESVVNFDEKKMLEKFNQNYRFKENTENIDDMLLEKIDGNKNRYKLDILKIKKKGASFKRFAAIAAGIVIFSMALHLTNETYITFAGHSLFDIVAEWTEEIFSKAYVNRYEDTEIQSREKNLKNSEKIFKNIDTIQEKYGIIFLKPTYIPSGFELEKVEVSEKKKNEASDIKIMYIFGERYISFNIKKIKREGDGGYLEKNKEGVRIELIGNTEYYIFENLEWTVVSWCENDMDYTIMGDISYDEALKIIKSLEY